MCIRDSSGTPMVLRIDAPMIDSVCPTSVDASAASTAARSFCLLYTSDAADERSSVDLGGRRIIKKKKSHNSAGTADKHIKTRT